jgi:hypothetical protein
MKKLIFLIAFTCAAMCTNAQVSFGIKGGLYTFNVGGDLTLASGTQAYKLSILNAKYGYNGGVFLHVKATEKFFIRPEVTFNSNKVDYTLRNLKTPNSDTLRSERYNNIDIPFMLGTQLGPLRIMAGPVAHINIGGTSDLTNIVGYKSKFDTALWGYQVGLLAGLGEKIVLDLKYEGNFSKFGNNISYDGKDYAFAKSAQRFIIGVGYKLF